MSRIWLANIPEVRNEIADIYSRGLKILNGIDVPYSGKGWRLESKVDVILYARRSRKNGYPRIVFLDSFHGDAVLIDQEGWVGVNLDTLDSGVARAWSFAGYCYVPLRSTERVNVSTEKKVDDALAGLSEMICPEYTCHTMALFKCPDQGFFQKMIREVRLAEHPIDRRLRKNLVRDYKDDAWKHHNAKAAHERFKSKEASKEASAKRQRLKALRRLRDVPAEIVVMAKLSKLAKI